MNLDVILPEDAWHMVETGAELLEHEGMVVVAGVYKHWAVCPTRQGQTGGYMAFLIPSH